MAQSKDNILVQGFSGTISRMLTFTQRSGKTFVARLRKKTKKEPSAKQLDTRERFLDAARYARNAILDADLKKAYEQKAEPGQTAYNLAFKDAFKAPVIEAINVSAYKGQPGNIISIEAKDDLKVERVLVSIYAPQNDLLEEGNAVQIADSFKWIYTVTQLNGSPDESRLVITVFDLPGNQASMEVNLEG